MPTWAIVLILVVLALPGIVAVLAGVIAMFFAPADYDRRKKWMDEGKCVYCGTDLGDSSARCPACEKPPFQPNR